MPDSLNCLIPRVIKELSFAKLEGQADDHSSDNLRKMVRDDAYQGTDTEGEDGPSTAFYFATTTHVKVSDDWMAQEFNL